MEAHNDELVSVLVPKRHLTAVYGFIAGLDSGRAAKPATGTAQPSSPDQRGDTEAAKARLTPDMIKRIYDESPKAMREILRFLADNPGQEFSTRDLGQALSNDDIKPNTVAGTLGAFGRRMKNRYQLNGVAPFTSRWDRDAGMAYHHMNWEQAEAISTL